MNLKTLAVASAIAAAWWVAMRRIAIFSDGFYWPNFVGSGAFDTCFTHTFSYWRRCLSGSCDLIRIGSDRHGPDHLQFVTFNGVRSR